MIGIVFLFIGDSALITAIDIKIDTDATIKEPVFIGRKYLPVIMLS